MKIITEIDDRDKRFYDSRVVLSSKNGWFDLFEYTDKSNGDIFYEVKPFKSILSNTNIIVIDIIRQSIFNKPESVTITINEKKIKLSYMRLNYAKDFSKMLQEAIEFSEEITEYLKKNNMWEGN